MSEQITDLRRIDAMLTNKRKNEDGTWIVDAICPNCEASRTLTFFHWSAVICSGCGCELVRPKLHKGGPGRPISGGDGRRTRSIRMSDLEWTTIAAAAKARGMNKSSYLRALALRSDGGEWDETTKRALSEVVDALEAFADDWNSARATDPTVLLPMLREALRG